jgi:hypothetical protein
MPSFRVDMNVWLTCVMVDPACYRIGLDTAAALANKRRTQDELASMGEAPTAANAHIWNTGGAPLSSYAKEIVELLVPFTAHFYKKINVSPPICYNGECHYTYREYTHGSRVHVWLKAC